MLSIIIQISISPMSVSMYGHLPCYRNNWSTLIAASTFQSSMLGSGHPTLVPHWTRSFPMLTRLTSHSVLKSAGRKAWREDGPTEGKCLWEMHGVWGWDLKKDEGVVLRENYFVKD